MKNNLKTFEAISLIAMITVTQIVLGFPQYIINITSTGSISNILFLTFLIFIICALLNKLFKEFPNSDIIDISEFVGGNILKFIVSIFIIIYLFINIIITISNYSYLLKSIYFSDLSYVVILAFFIVTLIIVTKKGIYPIKKIACIFCPILILTIPFLLFSFGNNDITINNISPILGYNLKTTFIDGLQNIFIFNFILLYYFIMPKLKKKNSYGKVIFSSFFINSILLIIALIAILEYLPTSITKELNNLNVLNSIYLITRTISLSDFISQTDALFIFIWSFSILTYICLCSYAITYIFNKLFNYSSPTQTIFPISLIISGICFYCNKIYIIRFLENYIFKIFSIVLIIITLFTVLLIGYIKKRFNLKRQKGKIYAEKP